MDSATLEMVREKIEQKSASPELSGFAHAIQSAAANQMQRETLRKALHFVAAAGGIGMGVRGLAGLAGMLRSNRPKPMSAVSPIVLEVPVHNGEEGEQKYAFDFGKFMKGDSAVTPAGIPWAMPAFVLGGGAAGYGGWKMMDSLLEQRRKDELEGELEMARNDFRKALHEQALGGGKTASGEPTLNEKLDRLFDMTEKAANVFEQPGHYAGMATGMYGTIGGLATIGTALAVYNAMKKRQERSLVERAQKTRMRKLYEQQPLPIYTKPVHSSKLETRNSKNPSDQGWYDELDKSAKA